jgi:DNA-binding transcriptional ArsR family regulator
MDGVGCFGQCRNMGSEPNIANMAALIGDIRRAAFLTPLAHGRAALAGELAAAAFLSPAAASAHLAKLTEDVVAPARTWGQGDIRCRYLDGERRTWRNLLASRP